MPPNKLGKIARVLALAGAEYRQTHFHVPPVTFHFVRIIPVFIYQLLWMVHGLQWICMFISVVVRLPAVGDNVRRSIQSFMIGKIVALLLSSTATKKTSPWIFFYITKYHCPLTLCPRWHFPFPTLLSSIWTTFFSLQIFSLFLHGNFTCFSAKHIPGNSCVVTNVQLFLYLLFRQSLRPPVGELNNLFQGKFILARTFWQVHVFTTNGAGAFGGDHSFIH